MITDRIGRHKVLLPINHKSYNFGKKKNSQVMKERENLQLKENCNFYVNCNFFFMISNGNRTECNFYD